MAQTIIDVATYILERTDTVTTMKLQKLAFYAQVQHLVTTGAPLFPEDFRRGGAARLYPNSSALHPRESF